MLGIFWHWRSALSYLPLHLPWHVSAPARTRDDLGRTPRRLDLLPCSGCLGAAAGVCVSDSPHLRVGARAFPHSPTRQDAPGSSRASPGPAGGLRSGGDLARKPRLSCEGRWVGPVYGLGFRGCSGRAGRAACGVMWSGGVSTVRASCRPAMTVLGLGTLPVLVAPGSSHAAVLSSRVSA